MSELQEAEAIQLRRAERVAFDLMVKYRLWGFRGTIMLKDMTPYGARVEGLPDLRMGDEITLLLPELQPKLSTVVWAEGSAAGVEFDHPLHGEVFKDIEPACSFLGTSALINPGWLVEIEADAVVTR